MYAYQQAASLARHLELTYLEMQALNRLARLEGGPETTSRLTEVYGQIEGGDDEVEMAEARSLLGSVGVDRL